MNTQALENLLQAGENVRPDPVKPLVGEPERGPKRSLTVSGEASAEVPARLPRRIAGGFRGVGDDLDRRAREWRGIVRLLEQQRPQVEAAESERERAAAALGRIVPEVQESGRALKALLDSAQTGDIGGDLTGQFNKSLNALNELESVTEQLTVSLLWLRSSWEEYARTIIRAQRMRDELKQDLSDR